MKINEILLYLERSVNCKSLTEPLTVVAENNPHQLKCFITQSYVVIFE